MHALVFGCGYLGKRVARLWREAGHTVSVVTRITDRAAAFAQSGYQTIVADVLRPASLANLPRADVVLYAIGFDRSAGVSIHEVYVNGLSNVLAALPIDTGKFVYVSSTGVYGQSRDEWVDEDSPTEPKRDGGRACLAAEQALATHPLGARTIVLRMAGLYGPGRVPVAEAIRRGQPLAAPRDGYLNLIHVDDAAQVVLAAAEHAAPPGMYIVSDNHPVAREDYYRAIARLLGAPALQFVEPVSDSPASARASASKRVRANRLSELAVTLAYPDYRAGLAAILAAGSIEPSPG